MSLLAVRNLTKRYGGLVVSDGIDLDVAPGELHAIIGPNGAGKTTLIDQLSGRLAPDGGSIRFDGHDVTREPAHRRARRGMARTYQIISLFADFSVLENVVLAVQGVSGSSFGSWTPVLRQKPLVARARAALDDVGLGAHADRPVAALSHGLRRLLDIAMALAMAPKLLLLDEPLAGLGAAEAGALATLLERLKGRCAMLLVEHDMEVIFAIADRVTVLVYGRVIASGPPSVIKADPAVRDAYLGTETAFET